VEDDDEMRASLIEILRPRYHLFEAPNGALGLEMARKERPELIVSDVMMPVMSGFQMATKLRAEPELADLPIIFLTARQEVGDTLEGLSAGGNDYLGKPFSPLELIARIDTQLRLRDAAARGAQSEKLATLGLLTSGFAHEVRNPLNALLNALEPLRAAVLDEVDKDVARAMLEVISECGNRMRGLAESLLSFARSSPTLEEIDVEETIEASLRVLAWKLPKGLKVDRKFCGQCRIISNPGPLSEVWLNLLDNAMRAVGEKGTIAIETRREEKTLHVKIRDDGAGIRPSDLERLFQPFFTTRKAGEGTGLGLALCRRIVLEAGGRIDVESEHGKGSCFTVSLPVERPVSTQADEQDTAA
jgi:signal transduction histidine kinase